jgi:hypothetical protein
LLGQLFRHPDRSYYPARVRRIYALRCISAYE